MKAPHLSVMQLWLFSTTLATGIIANPVYAIDFTGQTTFGGSGDQVGTGITVNSNGVYFSGTTANSSQAVMGQYASNLGATPLWNRTWAGGLEETFNGITATAGGVYTAGRSYNYTSDIVGGKERKGITVKFNSDGTAGAGIAGAVWSRQTPAAPGGFPYGGHEWLTGISSAQEAGQNYLYTVGVGERTGFTSNWGTFLTKMDESGNVLWSKNDYTYTNYLNPAAVAATGTNVYLATRSDNSGEHPYLKNYDTNGNLLWGKTSTTIGEYQGVTFTNNQIFAVGQAPIGSGNTDFLIESWDNAGNLLWSKTYDRNLGDDILNGVVAYNDRLYAVGSTTGNTAGGKDGIILDLDIATGALLASTLWGGAEDDLFAGVALFNTNLYAVGSTKSFGALGSDIVIANYSVPLPGSLVFLFTGLFGLVFTAKNRQTILGMK